MLQDQKATPKPIPFDKYEQMGAYHWAECDKKSKNYNPPLDARYQVLLKRIVTANRILDLGCGDGYLMNQVRMSCYQVIGIDSELTGVKCAVDKLHDYSNCNVWNASCYELPLADMSFDVVIMTDVIEHLDVPEDCLDEIRRVLKSDGVLIITTPKWRPDRMWDRRHFKEYKADELLGLLRPYFSETSLRFFCPLLLSRLYSTRMGWRALRVFCRYFRNPFLREGDNPDKYGQIIAICEGPT